MLNNNKSDHGEGVPAYLAALLQQKQDQDARLAGDHALVEAYLATLQKDEDPTSRCLAADLLGALLRGTDLPEGVAGLLKACDDSNAAVRMRALAGLGRARFVAYSAEMETTILRQFFHHDDEVVREAVRAIGHLTDVRLNDRVRKELLDVLHNLSPRIRRSAVVALWPTANRPEVRRELKRLATEDPVEIVRDEASAILAETAVIELPQQVLAQMSRFTRAFRRLALYVNSHTADSSGVAFGHMGSDDGTQVSFTTANGTQHRLDIVSGPSLYSDGHFELQVQTTQELPHWGGSTLQCVLRPDPRVPELSLLLETQFYEDTNPKRLIADFYSGGLEPLVAWMQGDDLGQLDIPLSAITVSLKDEA